MKNAELNEEHWLCGQRGKTCVHTKEKQNIHTKVIPRQGSCKTHNETKLTNNSHSDEAQVYDIVIVSHFPICIQSLEYLIQ